MTQSIPNNHKIGNWLSQARSLFGGADAEAMYRMLKSRGVTDLEIAKNVGKSRQTISKVYGRLK